MRCEIICDDCIEAMKRFSDCSFDLVITSPPYNLKNSTGNGMRDGRGGKWAKAALQKGYATYSDNIPYAEYIAWQRRCLEEMMRLIPDDGAIFYNHKWRVQGGLIQDRREIIEGFPLRQIIIWRRKGGINFNSGYFLPTYEVVYLIAKPKFKLAPHANAMGDVWEIAQERGNPHPAPFPVELAERILRSVRGNRVLDPFCGSGTTGVAAMKWGWGFVGVDVSKEYCEMAKTRLGLEGRTNARP